MQIADPAGIAAAHVLLGVAHHVIGNQTEARARLETALAQAPASNSAKARRFGFHYERTRIVLARTLWLQGYPDRAVEVARQTVSGLAATEPVTTCIALIWGACVFRWTGDLTSAEQCIDRLIAHAEEHSLTPYEAVGYGLRGEVLIQRGAAETGAGLLRSSLETLYKERYELYATEFNGSLAQALAAIGRPEQALLTIDKTIARVERNGDLSMPELLRVKGSILLSVPARVDDAEACLMQSLELSRQQGARAWELRAAMDLAALWLDRGQGERARALLGPVYQQFVEGFDTVDLTAAKRLLSTLG